MRSYESGGAVDTAGIVAREGLKVLSGDALYANTNLAEAIAAECQDYVIKLKKTNLELLQDVLVSLSPSREGPTCT